MIARPRGERWLARESRGCIGPPLVRKTKAGQRAAHLRRRPVTSWRRDLAGPQLGDNTSERLTGRVERFREFAAQLVHLKVDVIVLGTPTALPAVLHETSSIPVVLGYSTDPVGAGFIAGLASPAGTLLGSQARKRRSAEATRSADHSHPQPVARRPSRRWDEPKLIPDYQAGSSGGFGCWPSAGTDRG